MMKKKISELVGVVIVVVAVGVGSVVVWVVVLVVETAVLEVVEQVCHIAAGHWGGWVEAVKTVVVVIAVIANQVVVLGVANVIKVPAGLACDWSIAVWSAVTVRDIYTGCFQENL